MVEFESTRNRCGFTVDNLNGCVVKVCNTTISTNV